MTELSISEKTWGPITAALYVTDRNTIIVHGSYHDEDINRDYQGPTYEIAVIPQELASLKQERPHRYIHSAGWQCFIRGLWKIVQDNPWFRYV